MLRPSSVLQIREGSDSGGTRTGKVSLNHSLVLPSESRLLERKVPRRDSVWSPRAVGMTGL